MRIKILIFFSGIIFIGNCQTKSTDTVKPKTLLVKPQVKILDTVNPITERKSSPTQTVPSRDAKIYIVKEKSDTTDWAKYLLPIATLLLGIGVNRFIDWNNERKKLVKAGQRWIIEIRSTELPIRQQIENLQTFVVELDLKKWENPQLSIMTAINGEIFKSLDKNDLFKFIKLNKIPKWYTFPFLRKNSVIEKEDAEVVITSNTVQGHIAILMHQYEMMVQKWNDFQAGISKHSTALTADLQEMNKQMTLIHIALEKQGVDIGNDDRLKSIFELYTTRIAILRNDSTYNPLNLVTDLLNPLTELLNPLRANEIFTGLALSITSIFNDINGVKVEMEYMTVNLKTLISIYSRLLERIEPLVNQIKGFPNP